VERTVLAQAAARLSTIEFVTEFYQDFHAILMRGGVLADRDNTVWPGPVRRKTASNQSMGHIKISFSILHFFFMTGLRY
jgi:hypothetical protein